jgi:hypothetical protein
LKGDKDMSLTSSEMTPADIYAVTGGGNNNGFGGDNGFWIILLFLCLFGGWGGNNGFGGNCGGNGGFYPYYLANNTDNGVQRGFDNVALTSQLSGIQSSISNGFANAEVAECNRAMNAMERSFASQTAITGGLTNISSQIAQCCCDNRLATANLGSDIAREACATRTSDTQNTQLLLNAINGGIQSFKDQLCQDKIDAKNDEIAQLRQEVLYARGQDSQDIQTQRIVDQIYSRLDTCPVGTTPVYGRTPIFSCNQNSGCGCGCGSF